MPSQSPPPRDRARSRSPRPASPPRGPRNRGGGGGGGGGFRWKEKRREDNSDRDRTDDRGLQRGYRHDRSPRRDYHDRGRDQQNQFNPRRGDDNYRPGEGDRRNPESNRDRGRDRNRSRDRNREYSGRDDRQGQDNDAEGKHGRGGPRNEDRRAKSSKKEDDKPAASEKPKAPPANSGEPLMVVTVNDRLGTKAQITCLASDSVKLFKALVAAKIGRQPHEIMLKRQGERSFKDMLTLADYSVSNGVQLDLELDTGD